MSSSTISFVYTWPTFVRMCARIRSLLIVAGPVYSTSMARMTGGPGADGGACARAITAVKSVQREAIQIAIGGGRTHPQKRCILSEAQPHATQTDAGQAAISEIRPQSSRRDFPLNSRGPPLVESISQPARQDPADLARSSSQ